MKNRIAILMVAMIVALPAAAGGEKCHGSADDCLAKMQTKLAQKAWLGVEYELNDEGRWVIEKVYADSPAEAAGFRKGDVLLTMQGVEYSKDNKKAIKKVYTGIEPGSDVQYLVDRQGREVELDATLAHVPKDLQKKWIAEHMKSNHPEFQVAAKN